MSISRNEPQDLLNQKWLDEKFSSSNVVDVLDTTYRLELESGSITVDSTSSHNANGSGSTTLTWSHTIGSGSNRILIVSHPESRGITSTVTYGGTALTRVVQSTAGTTYASIHYLVNPTVGTANIVVTYSTSTTYRRAGAVSFFGVDQDDPIPTTGSTNGTAQNKSLNITTKYDNSYLVDSVGATGGIHTEEAGQTVIAPYSNTVACYKATTTKGTNGTSWTSTGSAQYNYVIAEIKQAYSDGSRTSPPLSLNGITKVKSSNIEWTSTTPTDTDLKIYTAISDSNTVEPTFPTDYDEEVSDTSIDSISTDQDLTGKYLWVRQELSTTNTSATPRLTTLLVSVADAITKKTNFFKFL